MRSTRSFHAFSVLVGLCGTLLATASTAQEAATQLSVGVTRDSLEATSVRVLAKFADSLTATDRLVPLKLDGDRSTFYTMSRQLIVDATDAGKLGGLSLRYGVRYYDVGLKEVPPGPGIPTTADGKPIRKFDGDRWMFVFPVEIGADADRDLKKHDYLIEFGFIPVRLRTDGCFKLGSSPLVGLAAQLGTRKRDQLPSQTSDQSASGPLRRLKAEAKLDLQLSCVLRTPSITSKTADSPLGLLGADIGSWQILLSSTAWRDFVEDKTYRYTEVTLRIPTQGSAYVDIKRESGAAPTSYPTGSKYTASLTVTF